MAIAFNAELAIETFVERYTSKESAENRAFSNSRLPAGSPMYYSCKHCGEHTETLPEGHMSRPKTVCDACEALVAHGLIPKALKAAKKAAAS